MMSELKYYIKELLIMKIRLQGTLDEINTYVKDMERFYTIIHQSLPYKNNRKCTQSIEYRSYMEIQIKK